MTVKRRASGPAARGPASRPAKRPAARPTKRPASTRRRVWRVARWFLLAGLVGALVAAAAVFYLYRTTDIPDPNSDFQTQTSFVYYSDGKSELGRFATQNRESIPLATMPQALQDAVVAAENRSFWTDRGIDPKGILRAAFNNAQGGSTQGASTITQQYVKILYLTQERSWQRKSKEAILSLKIHNQLSKSEILEGYLNTIYFGRGAYGVQAASQAYFDKPAAELSLRESVVIASVLNNPSRFDPANGRDARDQLKARYAAVLDGMVEQGDLTAEESERAARRLPAFPEIEAESQYGGQRGHALTLVREELLRLGFTEEEIDGGGLRVTTTFTRAAMSAAAAGVAEARPDGFGDRSLHVGVASVEPGTGALRGFYGGQDYLDSQLNWAVAGGQAGSTMKPAALVAALEDGYSLRDTFEGNSPLVLPDGTEFENQGNTSYGSAIDMVTATENSVNTAFVDMTLGMDDGPEKVIDAANAMGIPPATPRGSAAGFPASSPGLEPIAGVALGNATVSPINMAAAFGTLANRGRAAEPFVIDEVRDADGETRYRHRVSEEEAMRPAIAADVTFALQQVVTSGSGEAALALGRPAAGKTGTATNGRGEVSSAWFAGYTPQLSTAVMYVRGKGNEQLQGWLPSYFGGGYPAETWTAVMRRAMEGLPVQDFPPPAYVDGEAPDEGHAPAPTPEPTTSQLPSPTAPPPPTSQAPTQPTGQPSSQSPTLPPSQPTGQPTSQPPTQPTGAPSTTPPSPRPTSPGPTDCTILGTCQPPSPTPTRTPQPSPTNGRPEPSPGPR